MFAFFYLILYNLNMTDKQRELNVKLDLMLNFIKEYTLECGYPPSVREICRELNISSTATVKYYMDKLVARGDILKSPQKKRALEVKNMPKIEDNFSSVPLVGRVHAGALHLAEENYDDTFMFSQNLFGKSEMFMLTINGDSMIEAGIHDGDLVVVKKQPTANNGDIVVALVDGEATIKRFYKKKNYFLLHPENKDLDDIVVLKLDILGVVVGLVRKYM